MPGVRATAKLQFSCHMIHRGCGGVRPEARAQQIQHFVGLQCQLLLLPLAVQSWTLRQNCCQQDHVQMPSCSPMLPRSGLLPWEGTQENARPCCYLKHPSGQVCQGRQFLHEPSARPLALSAESLSRLCGVRPEARAQQLKHVGGWQCSPALKQCEDRNLINMPSLSSLFFGCAELDLNPRLL